MGRTWNVVENFYPTPLPRSIPPPRPRKPPPRLSPLPKSPLPLPRKPPPGAPLLPPLMGPPIPGGGGPPGPPNPGSGGLQTIKMLGSWKIANQYSHLLSEQRFFSQEYWEECKRRCALGKFLSISHWVCNLSFYIIFRIRQTRRGSKSFFEYWVLATLNLA